MITLQQFVDKWNGKVCDWDGAYGGQCVDLFRQYVNEVLGLSQTPPVIGAKDIWTGETPGFEKIKNTTTGVPSIGDVMIWGAKYGNFGHVAIVTSATVDNFTCFSQNDPSGAKCGYKNYASYANTLGWLHPIAVVDNSYKGYDLTNMDSMRVAVDVLVQLQSGELVRKSDLENLTKKIADLEKSQKTLASKVAELEAIDSDYKSKLEISSQANQMLTEENQKLVTDIEYYKPYKNRYEEALTKVPNSMTGRQLIALGIKKLLAKK